MENLNRPLTDSIRREARLSDDGAYRYELVRMWGSGISHILWVMLNPSIADASIDDPTIRRCTGFTSDWGFNAYTVVNLYAFRSTSPLRLRFAADTVGPENGQAIRGAARHAQLIICAWGHAGPNANRPNEVVSLLVSAGHKDKLRRLGTRKNGQPRHPLMLGGNCKPLPFWG